MGNCIPGAFLMYIARYSSSTLHKNSNLIPSIYISCCVYCFSQTAVIPDAYLLKKSKESIFAKGNSSENPLTTSRKSVIKAFNECLSCFQYSGLTFSNRFSHSPSDALTWSCITIILQISSHWVSYRVLYKCVRKPSLSCILLSLYNACVLRFKHWKMWTPHGGQL